METENIKKLTGMFESYSNKLENGIEFWFARDLQHLLGYQKWDNFSKAKIAIKTSNEDINNHFAEVGKMVKLGLGSEREVGDIMLTMYACYLIAMNGDSSKEEIAFAQQYFALQTRKYEIIEQRILKAERVSARHKLIETEKELSQIIYEQTGNDKDFGTIRSKGDKALFGKTTQEMKTKWGVSGTKSLAGFMPTYC